MCKQTNSVVPILESVFYKKTERIFVYIITGLDCKFFGSTGEPPAFQTFGPIQWSVACLLCILIGRKFGKPLLQCLMKNCIKIGNISFDQLSKHVIEFEFEFECSSSNPEWVQLIKHTIILNYYFQCTSYSATIVSPSHNPRICHAHRSN